MLILSRIWPQFFLVLLRVYFDLYPVFIFPRCCSCLPWTNMEKQNMFFSSLSFIPSSDFFFSNNVEEKICDGIFHDMQTFKHVRI